MAAPLTHCPIHNSRLMVHAGQVICRICIEGVCCRKALDGKRCPDHVEEDWSARPPKPEVGSW